MDIEQMLRDTGAAEAISRDLGVDPATARSGAVALMPSILSGLSNPVVASGLQGAGGDQSNSGGLGGLLSTIGSLGGGRLLDNVTSQEPTEMAKGNQILGQLFGSKDGSRAIAASAATQSGVEPSLLKKMLPILAMIAAGYVMKQAGQGQGGLGGALGDILGNQPARGPGQVGTIAPASGGILDDLISAAGKFLGR